MSLFGAWLRATLLPPQVTLSTIAPISESTAPAIGTGGMAARNDHAHPRLTSTQWGTTDSNGEVSYAFTRSFANMPGISVTYVEASTTAQPIIFRVKSWIQDGGGNYTGCTLRGARLQTLPASITLLTALVSFNVGGGTVGAGIPVSCIAVQQS